MEGEHTEGLRVWCHLIANKAYLGVDMIYDGPSMSNQALDFQARFYFYHSPTPSPDLCRQMSCSNGRPQIR